MSELKKRGRSLDSSSSSERGANDAGSEHADASAIDTTSASISMMHQTPVLSNSIRAPLNIANPISNPDLNLHHVDDKGNSQQPPEKKALGFLAQLEAERDTNRIVRKSEASTFPWLRDARDLKQLTQRIIDEKPILSINRSTNATSVTNAKLVNVLESDPNGDEFGGHILVYTLIDDGPSDATRAVQEEEILKTHLMANSRNGPIEVASFWDVWKNPTSNLKKRLQESEDPQEDKWKFRREFNYKLATNFMPGYARALYEQFAAGKILDPCAGWGDRLMGALCADSKIVKKYVAFDPNRCLRPGYAEIARLRGHHVVDLKDNHMRFSNDFEIHSLPFEVGAKMLHDNSFDFAFTSPPFFNYEMYNPDNPDYKDWIAEFYVPLFQETCRVIKPNAFFGIHIGDTSAGKISHFIANQISNISDFEYRYKIGLRGMKSDEIRSVYMYQKLPEKTLRRQYIYSVTNPPINISNFTYNGNTYTVINDGKCCIGGSKQRLLGRLLGHLPHKELVYAGPEQGLAQVALALTCGLWGRKATIFLNTFKGVKTLPLLTKCAIALGANIMFTDNPNGRSLHDTEKAALEYCNEKDEQSNRYQVPFGLKNKPGELFFETFKEALIEAITLGGLEVENNKNNSSSISSSSGGGGGSSSSRSRSPERLWLVAGSSFLLTVLHSIWPSTKFLVVQVGKTVWPDMLAGIDHELFVAPEKFNELAKHQPPFPTVKTYDAKLWQFVMKHGKHGDFIWNVGREPTDEEVRLYTSAL